MDSDRIEKKVLLKASRERVWDALSDAVQFGTWFGVSFDGPFVAGRRLTGRIEPTKVDAQVARLQEPYRGKEFEFFVESIEPMERIRFRWHPYAVEATTDYSREPTTLIVFQLHATEAGIELTITESGFDQIPLARRAQAFAANEGGWEHQSRLIKTYVEG